MTASHEICDSVSETIRPENDETAKPFLVNADRSSTAKRFRIAGTLTPKKGERRDRTGNGNMKKGCCANSAGPSLVLSPESNETTGDSSGAIDLEKLGLAVNDAALSPKEARPPSFAGLSIPVRRVRFSPELETVVGRADENYDRRSIEVDLSKTPFALFHKDAVLMRKPQFTAPPSPGNSSSAGGKGNCGGFCGGSWESDSYDTDNSGMTSDTESSSDEEGVNKGHPRFYGVWKRISSEGFETLLRFSGVSKRAASIAARKHPVHIIDHDGSYFRVIVKNGLSKIDNSFFIGDEPREDVINNLVYEVSLRWGDLSGDGNRESLVLTSICRSKGEEVIAIRTLEDGGDRLELTQIVRRPAKNEEVRAKHIFHRVKHRSELRSARGPGSSDKSISPTLSAQLRAVQPPRPPSPVSPSAVLIPKHTIPKGSIGTTSAAVDAAVTKV